MRKASDTMKGTPGMMSRLANILFAFLLVSGGVVGPVDANAQNVRDSSASIGREILAHPETDLAILGKARAVLTEAITSADTSKAKRVLGFLESHFVLTPYVGVAAINFSPPSDESEKAGNDVSLTVGAFALGLNCDYPLSETSGGLVLRFCIGQRFAMTGFSPAKGGYTFVTLGVDFFNRPQYLDR
jgi:hypothetical protein